ncbi:MAG: hypothetical protein OJI67_22925, partial [Prosthecobacter sp.]|nr:hypothetical protein [Prosthecobacter sp.]
MKYFTLLSLAVFCLLSTVSLRAATSLSAGDIAFTGYNSESTNDSFSFILLKDIDSGTVIKFTDRGWDDSTGFRTEFENELTWTSSTDMTLGSQVTIRRQPAMSATVGTVSVTDGVNDFDLSSAGDQLFAYQGTIASPVFLTGIHANLETTGTVTTAADWDGAGSAGASTLRTALPDALGADGVNALALFIGGTENDDAIYRGPLTGTAAALRALINNRANWEFDNTTEFPLPPAYTPIEGITTFDALYYNNTFIEITGPVQSAAAPGLVGNSVQGWDIRVIAVTNAVDCGIGIEPFTAQTPLVYGYSNAGATALEALELSANDGKIFDLQAVDIVVDGAVINGTPVTDATPIPVKLVGYRDGNPVASAELVQNLPSASYSSSSLTTYTVSGNSAFIGIDMFRIETSGIYTIGYAVGVDNVNAINFRDAGAASLATVTTATQSDVTSSSATLGGEVTSDGGAAVSDRGIVWGTSPAPTTANNKVANGSGTGTFSATVTSLPASTLIYVRAYAINSEGTNYGSEISFTTSAPVADEAIFQGSFVGNGSARTISIPTVTPTFVMVKNGALSSPATQQHAVVRVAGMTDSSAMANAAVYADGITGLNSGGFTLGADAAVNESGTTIHWLAIKDVAGKIKTGSYVGNGGDNRGITGVGFQPDLVWVIARAQFDGGTSPAGSSYRTSTMSGDTSLPWTGTSAKADYVQAISSDGFEVGTNTMVNASGVTYYYLAMKNTAGLFNVGTYVGNATDNRELTGFGFAPDAFFTKSATTSVSGVFKLTSTGASTDLTYLTNLGYPVADLIQKLLPDGVELGAATRANTNGAPFHWFGMKASPIPSGSASAPTVTTPTSASVTHNSATLGGNVTSDGGASITERGVVYALTATNADPEIAG